MKPMKILAMLSMATVGLTAVGCDSTSKCTDAGVCPDTGGGGNTGLGGTSGLGGAGGAPATLYGLTEGSYCFDVTAVTVGVDGCDTGVGDADPQIGLLGATLPVTYTSANATVSLGTMGTLGTGTINQNKGTLNRSNVTAADQMPTCTWTQTDKTMFQLVGTNSFTAAVTETQSGFAAACNPPPPSDPCTSTFTLSMKIHTPGVMADAVTGKCP
jgi:hypothetical protein